MMRECPEMTTVMVGFRIMDALLAYNGTSRRLSWLTIRMVLSTIHQMMKFHTEQGVGQVRNNHQSNIKKYNLTTMKTKL